VQVLGRVGRVSNAWQNGRRKCTVYKLFCPSAVVGGGRMQWGKGRSRADAIMRRSMPARLPMATVAVARYVGVEQRAMAMVCHGQCGVGMEACGVKVGWVEAEKDCSVCARKGVRSGVCGVAVRVCARVCGVCGSWRQKGSRWRQAALRVRRQAAVRGGANGDMQQNETEHGGV